MWFCIDYGKLNSIIVLNQYPIPRVDECLEYLATARLFSTLDANYLY